MALAAAFHDVAVLVRAEVRLEARTGDVLRTVVPYAAGGMLLFGLSVGADAASLRRVGVGAAWTVILLFGSQAAARRGLLDEAAVRELVVVTGVPGRRVLAARIVTMTGLLSVLLAVLVPTAIALFDLPTTGGLWLLATLGLAVVGLGTLTAIAGALVAAGSVRAVLAPLLVVPLTVPLLLAVVQLPDAAAHGASPGSWVLLAAVVDVAILTTSWGVAPWLQGAST